MENDDRIAIKPCSLPSTYAHIHFRRCPWRTALIQRLACELMQDPFFLMLIQKLQGHASQASPLLVPLFLLPILLKRLLF